MQAPTGTSARKISANQLLEYATLAAETAQDLSQASQVPFLQTAAITSLRVLNGIQVVSFCMTVPD